MPRSKAPVLGRIVRREMRKLERNASYQTRGSVIDMAELRGAIQRVAAECAKIVDDSAKRIDSTGNLTGAPAVEWTAMRIREAFGLKERDATE